MKAFKNAYVSPRPIGLSTLVLMQPVLWSLTIESIEENCLRWVRKQKEARASQFTSKSTERLSIYSDWETAANYLKWISKEEITSKKPLIVIKWVHNFCRENDFSYTIAALCLFIKIFEYGAAIHICRLYNSKMGRKIRFSRFSAPRRSKFHSYMNIVSILPEFALLIKTI